MVLSTTAAKAKSAAAREPSASSNAARDCQGTVAGQQWGDDGPKPASIASSSTSESLQIPTPNRMANCACRNGGAHLFLTTFHAFPTPGVS